VTASSSSSGVGCMNASLTAGGQVIEQPEVARSTFIQ
jgi:hypothetical protein